jgi:OOP family OmpA-OmpF porin
MYNTSSMNKLREIILGLKPDELYKLQQWLTDKDTFSEEVANILPSSVIKSIELSLPLGDVLMPIIEESIFASVQNNPKALADALFPIMGPAIRKSISDTFRSFIETLNQTLENRFSLKRIRWRLLSIFSSKSYAEIVLLNSISFNVKHIFLIHKETGLLIQDYSESGTTHESADMISSMLTAVQDFVKDSFAGDIRRDDSLDTIRLNELNVWIEAGPYAILAVIFDGMAPESMRIVFKEILEELHHKFGKLMKSFDGNSNAFTMVRSYLKKCAIKQKPKKTKNKNRLFY